MLTKADTGLIIVDVQGKLSELMHESSHLFDQVKRLINGAKVMWLRIVCMEQLPEILGSTRPEVADLLLKKALPRSTFSGWKTDGSANEIRQAGCSSCLVAGIEAQ